MNLNFLKLRDWKMKVLTLNVHGWMEKFASKKIKQLAQVIATKDYDVVALQEVNQPMKEGMTEHKRFIKPSQEVNLVPLKKGNYAGVLVKELEKFGKYYFWTWSANHIGYDKYDEGLAILSKTPQNSQVINISQSTEYDNVGTRNILKSEISIFDKKWLIFNGHFSWWEDPEDNQIFKHEWDRAQIALNENMKENIIFMGDFNNEASTYNKGYDYVLKTAPFLNDSYTIAQENYGYATMKGKIDGWKTTSDSKRIDYIFVSDKLTVQKNHVIFNQDNESIVSDHFGVEVIILE